MKYRSRIQAARVAMLASVALTALPASAQMAEQTLREFSGCTSSFFSALAQDAAARQVLPAQEQKGDLAWIKVKDRKTAPENQVNFAAPVTVGGLKLLAYFDEVTDLQEVGHYYYWGFVVEGSVAQVIDNLRPLVKDADRLRTSGSDYARTEIMVGQANWLVVDTHASSVPRQNTIERAFIVESMENDKQATRVSCSLQGSVSPAVLKTERPDLDAADWPATALDGKRDRSNPPARVIAAIDAAAPPASIWRPRFSKLATTFSYQGKKPFTLRLTMENVGGLLRISENDSDTSSIERLSFMGIQHLSSQSYVKKVEVSSAPYLTTSLALSLPPSLEPGQTLSFKSMAQRYGDPKSVPTAIDRSCKITQTIAASGIHPSLTGSAALLDCTLGTKIYRYAFLQDLGVAVLIRSGEDDVLYPDFSVTP
jgi:hypothetical protein